MSNSSEQPPYPKHIAAGAISGVTFVQIAATMAIMTPPALAPILADVFGVPASWIGLQVTWTYFGAICMSIWVGLMVRRFGAIRTNQFAAVLVFVSLVLMSVPTFVTFLMGSYGVGLAHGLTNPSASHVMMKVANPQNRNLIFSVKQTGQPLGAVLAGLMIPPIAVAFGWQASMWVGACIAFVILVSIQPLRPIFDGDRDPRTRFRGAILRDTMMVWRNAKLRWLGISAIAMTAVQMALMAFTVTMLVDDLSFDLVVAGIGLAVLQIAGGAGRLFWGYVADRIKSGLIALIIGQLVAVAGAWMTWGLTPETPVWAVYVALAIFGASAVAWNGVFMAEAARLAPNGQVSSATGGVMVPVFIGGMSGPFVVTQLQNSIDSYGIAFLILSLVSLIAAAAIVRLWVLDRRTA